MRIACPFCGERGIEEFSYFADASVSRPKADAAAEAFTEYVYFRTNIAGAHREIWYHASACRQFLRVERDTRSHQILSVRAL
jgi:heterotetrameric sarcosine oxidase delta subunit